MPETENQAPSAAARFGQVRAAGIAVHQQLERADFIFFFKDLRHDLVSLARMYDQRQTTFACRFNVRAENAHLDIARAQVIMEIETAFADADHFGHLRQCKRVWTVRPGFFTRFMRMRAGGGPDIGMIMGQPVDGVEVRHAIADIDHEIDAGVARALNDIGAVLIELRGVQIDMGINISAINHINSHITLIYRLQIVVNGPKIVTTVKIDGFDFGDRIVQLGP